jgi:hypothetical protein
MIFMSARLHENEQKGIENAERGDRRNFSKWKSVVAGIAAAVGIHACGYEGDGIIPITTLDGGSEARVDSGTEEDGGQDSGVDASIDGGHDGGLDGGSEGGMDGGVSDGGSDGGTIDGGSDGGMADAGIDAGHDGGMDAGPDGAIDSGVIDAGMDGGMTDGGVDAGPDVDAGTPCTLVNTSSALYVFPIGSDVTIGGADFRYAASTGASTLTWDTRCDADGSSIEVGASLTVGILHEIPYNGHTIRITVNSKNAASATATVGIF